jgi:hypothetical protein
MTRLLVVLIASWMTASCAAVRSNLVVTHMLPSSGSGKTVAILPYTESPAADFAAHAAKLAAHLQSEGYALVSPSDGPAPDYLAFFMVGIDGGTSVTNYDTRPLVTDTLISSDVQGTLVIPQEVPAQDQTASGRRVYKRIVLLDMYERARFRPNEPASFAAAKVFSAWMMSEGSCSMVDAVIDPMLSALFSDFPGENGAFRVLEVQADAAWPPALRLNAARFFAARRTSAT